MKYLIMLWIVLLTIYAPIELTRYIIAYGRLIPHPTVPIYLELATMWLFYGIAILVLNKFIVVVRK